MVLQPDASITFIAQSTGIKSTMFFKFISMTRIKPVENANMIPIGPKRLSPHPGIGSSMAGMTKTIREIV